MVAFDTADHCFFFYTVAFLPPLASLILWIFFFLSLFSLLPSPYLFFIFFWPLNVDALRNLVIDSLLFSSLTHSLVFSSSLLALKYPLWESSKWFPNLYHQARFLSSAPDLYISNCLLNLSCWISKNYLKCNMSKKVSPSLSSSLSSDDSNSIYSATQIKTFKSFVTPIFISYVIIEHNRNVMNPTFNIYSKSSSYYLHSCVSSLNFISWLLIGACFYSWPFTIILNKAARVALLKLWWCITLLQCCFIFSKLYKWYHNLWFLITCWPCLFFFFFFILIALWLHVPPCCVLNSQAWAIQLFLPRYLYRQFHHFLYALARISHSQGGIPLVAYLPVPFLYTEFFLPWSLYFYKSKVLGSEHFILIY